MMSQRDCPTLDQILEPLFDGRLSPGAIEAFRHHALSCAQCTAVARLHAHLLPSSLAEAEARVPGDVAATVWPLVQRALPTGRGLTQRPLRRSGRWATAALAAATIAFVAVSGVLLTRLGDARQRERALAAEVADLGRQLDRGDPRHAGDPAARTARLARTGVWERALQRRPYIRVSELRQLLRDAPGGRTILDASAAQALVHEAPSWATRIGPALDGIDISDGLQVQELLVVLDKLALTADMRLPTSDLFPRTAGS